MHWHRDSPLLHKSLASQGMQLSISYYKSQGVLQFLLQMSGCCRCGESPPPQSLLLLAAACGHPAPALLPACSVSPGKYFKTAVSKMLWSVRDFTARLLKKPTQPIYTATAAAEVEQTEHLQTQENNTASFQKIIIIHKMYSSFVHP